MMLLVANQVDVACMPGWAPGWYWVIQWVYTSVFHCLVTSHISQIGNMDKRRQWIRAEGQESGDFFRNINSSLVESREVIRRITAYWLDCTCFGVHHWHYVMQKKISHVVLYSVPRRWQQVRTGELERGCDIPTLYAEAGRFIPRPYRVVAINKLDYESWWFLMERSRRAVILRHQWSDRVHGISGQ